jgi:hypothetical protein
MLVKAPEEGVSDGSPGLCRVPDEPTLWRRYQVNGATLRFTPRKTLKIILPVPPVVTADWVEAEQLFGCVRQFNGEITFSRAWYIGQRRRADYLSAHPAGAAAAVDASENHGDPSAF